MTRALIFALLLGVSACKPAAQAERPPVSPTIVEARATSVEPFMPEGWDGETAVFLVRWSMKNEGFEPIDAARLPRPVLAAPDGQAFRSEQTLVGVDGELVDGTATPLLGNQVLEGADLVSVPRRVADAGGLKVEWWKAAPVTPAQG